jgi:hypothetical protein
VYAPSKTIKILVQKLKNVKLNFNRDSTSSAYIFSLSLFSSGGGGGGRGAIICAQLPRLIRVLITHKTDPKWFGNSSFVNLCTLKWFLGSSKILGPPRWPLEVDGPKMRYS